MIFYFEFRKLQVEFDLKMRQVANICDGWTKSNNYFITMMYGCVGPGAKYVRSLLAKKVVLYYNSGILFALLTCVCFH